MAGFRKSDIVVNSLLAFVQSKVEIDEFNLELICLTRWSDYDIQEARSVLSQATAVPMTQNRSNSSKIIQDIIKMFRCTKADNIPTFVDAVELVKSIHMLKAELKDLRHKLEAQQANPVTTPSDVQNLRDMDSSKPPATPETNPHVDSASSVVSNSSSRIALGQRDDRFKVYAIVEPYNWKNDEGCRVVNTSPATTQRRRRRQVNRPSFINTSYFN